MFLHKREGHSKHTAKKEKLHWKRKLHSQEYLLSILNIVKMMDNIQESIMIWLSLAHKSLHFLAGNKSSPLLLALFIDWRPQTLSKISVGNASSADEKNNQPAEFFKGKNVAITTGCRLTVTVKTPCKRVWLSNGLIVNQIFQTLIGNVSDLCKFQWY